MIAGPNVLIDEARAERIYAAHRSGKRSGLDWPGYVRDYVLPFATPADLERLAAVVRARSTYPEHVPPTGSDPEEMAEWLDGLLA